MTLGDGFWAQVCWTDKHTESIACFGRSSDLVKLISCTWFAELLTFLQWMAALKVELLPTWALTYRM